MLIRNELGLFMQGQEISTDEYRVLAIPNGHTFPSKMNGADER